jgi:hypothetical protein
MTHHLPTFLIACLLAQVWRREHDDIPETKDTCTTFCHATTECAIVVGIFGVQWEFRYLAADDTVAEKLMDANEIKQILPSLQNQRLRR